MTNILLWVGIVVIIIGWIALGMQASNRMAMSQELARFPEKKAEMSLRRNYCFITIFFGCLLVLLALIF